MFESSYTLEMIQNTLFVNFDQILSKSSLRYVKEMFKLVKEYENLDLNNNEKMLKYFNDKKYLHAMLFYSTDMYSVINMTMEYSKSGQPIPTHQEYTSTEAKENNQCITYKHGQLICSCSFSFTYYSLLYCHMINVTTSLDPEYVVHHHNISCV